MDNSTSSRITAISGSGGISSSGTTKEVAQLQSNSTEKQRHRRDSRAAERKKVNSTRRADNQRKLPNADEQRKLKIKKIKKQQQQHEIFISEEISPPTKIWHQRLLDLATYYYEMATKGESEIYSLTNKKLTTTRDALYWLEKSGYVVQANALSRARLDTSLQGLTFIHLETNHEDAPDYMNFVRRCDNPDEKGRQLRRMLAEIPGNAFEEQRFYKSILKRCGLPDTAFEDISKKYGAVCVLIDDVEWCNRATAAFDDAYRAGCELLDAMQSMGLQANKAHGLRGYTDYGQKRLNEISQFAIEQWPHVQIELARTMANLESEGSMIQWPHSVFHKLHSKFSDMRIDFHGHPDKTSFKMLRKAFGDAHEAGLELLEFMRSHGADDIEKILQLQNATDYRRQILEEVERIYTKELGRKKKAAIDFWQTKLFAAYNLEHFELHKNFQRLKYTHDDIVSKSVSHRDKFFCKKIKEYSNSEWTNFFSVGNAHYPGLRKGLLKSVPVVFYMRRTEAERAQTGFRIEPAESVRWSDDKAS